MVFHWFHRDELRDIQTLLKNIKSLCNAEHRELTADRIHDVREAFQRESVQMTRLHLLLNALKRQYPRNVPANIQEIMERTQVILNAFRDIKKIFQKRTLPETKTLKSHVEVIEQEILIIQHLIRETGSRRAA